LTRWNDGMSDEPKKSRSLGMASRSKLKVVARTQKSQETDRAVASNLTVRPLREDDWRTIEELFGSNGACGGCWCMWWRVPRGGKLWTEVKGKKNRAAFRKLVEHGDVHGVLAFCGDNPVGWCSFGPRRSYVRLERVRALRRAWSERTWSILCFYIPAAWRRRGVATLLLKAATERAFELEAREVEGYPAVPKEPTGSMPAAFAWTGVPALFEAAGYHELRRHELPGQGGHRRVFLKAAARSASKSVGTRKKR
jgi:GNAT superfamily N-acetyltransferase